MILTSKLGTNYQRRTQALFFLQATITLYYFPTCANLEIPYRLKYFGSPHLEGQLKFKFDPWKPSWKGLEIKTHHKNKQLKETQSSVNKNIALKLDFSCLEKQKNQ